jgi:5-formyltetrahydrofolate cyclo-ligase
MPSPAKAAMPDTKQLKSELRRQSIARRDALPLAERTRAADLVARRCLELLERSGTPGTAALYAATRSELDASPIAAVLAQQGVAVAYPRVVGSALEFCLAAADALVPSNFELSEPSADLPALPIEQIDLFIIPGLAFDRAGGRLGWGKGYYDRALQQCPRATRVAVGFSLQIVQSVPRDRWDQTMDWIISEADTLQCSPRQGLIGT